MGTPERISIPLPKEGEHPVRNALWEALTAAEPEKGYEPDRQRQQKVFGRLDIERVASIKGIGKQVRGELFELLIQADPAFGERSALEKELLALAHSPEAFGLEKELGHFRNPDLAFLLVTKEDGVEIIGVGESKLGLLNARAFSQLSEEGFARGVKELVSVINSLEDPAKYGLIEIAKAKPIRIASDFSQLLVVPANRNIEWKSTLINRREFSAEGRQKFYEMLEDTTRVRTAKAAFSTAEVGAMAEVINL